MSGLTFDTVTKRFGDTIALDRFTLEIADGEFVALVGPSGCGKTTSLRVLAGLEEATSGRLMVGPHDVTHHAARDRNLAMVFQNYALYPHMTAAENIGFSLSLTRIGKAEIADRVQRAADRLGIGHLLHRRPRELSGGQRQRVAVARCIVREPGAFLFDEPLSNLDAKLRSSARVEIARLQKSLGITALYVTHDQVEAMTMADRVVLMEGGRIRQAGAPLELYDRPRDIFVASFLGAPAMNLVPGDIRRDLDGVRFSAPGLSVPLPGHAARAAGPATLGIRPEALTPAPDDLSAGRHVVLGATVLHVEALGAETLVRVCLRDAPDTEVVARVGGTLRVRADAPLRLEAAAEALHLFDAEGRAIDLGTAPALVEPGAGAAALT